MMDRTMRFLSLALHPLLMPTYTFALVFFFIPQVIKPLTIVILPFLFITTFIIPVLSISILKYSGTITDLKLENRAERPLPFAFVAIFYGITSYMFVYKIQVNTTVAAMLIITTVLIVLLTAISTKYKISIHSAGISGVIGFLMFFSIFYPSNQVTYLTMVVILIGGAAMTSRLYLNAHTPYQVLAGSILGFVMSFLGLYLYG